jgi:hypothetical protein
VRHCQILDREDLGAMQRVEFDAGRQNSTPTPVRLMCVYEQCVGFIFRCFFLRQIYPILKGAKLC